MRRKCNVANKYRLGGIRLQRLASPSGDKRNFLLSVENQYQGNSSVQSEKKLYLIRSQPIKTQSKNKEIAWSAGKHELPSRGWIEFYIWLVERTARVFWTNHWAKFSKTEAMPYNFTFDTQLKISLYVNLLNDEQCFASSCHSLSFRFARWYPQDCSSISVFPSSFCSESEVFRQRCFVQFVERLHQE